MFFGTHTPRLDEKGRIVLPARFRDALGEDLVVTRGRERCLYVFPSADFSRLAADYPTGASQTKADRDQVRMLFSAASDEQPDKQGRVTIPPALRAYARLERECVVIGAMDRVEIWDAAAWAEYSQHTEDAFADDDAGVVAST